MKTLSQILELYKPKSQDEDKFVKKHIVVKHRDRNGNGDDVFQATNVKAVGREKERHGYEPGKDEEVYEEYEDGEDLQELDVNPKNRVKLGKILKDPERTDPTTSRGQSNLRNITRNAEKGAAYSYGSRNLAATVYRQDKHDKQLGQYVNLRNKATKKLGKEYEEVYEEVERLDELSPELLRRAAAGARAKYKLAMDHNDDLGGGYENPVAREYNRKARKFDKGAENAERRDRIKSIGISRAVQRKLGMEEETEQLDEIGDKSRGQEILARVRARALERRDQAKAKISDLLDKQDAIAVVHGDRAARNMPQHKKLDIDIEAQFKKSDRAHDTADAAQARIDPARRSAMGLSKIKQHEQVEYLDEKLKVSDGIGAWISDFVHSKNPKFDGFSKRKRMKMAQAAFYSAQKGD